MPLAPWEKEEMVPVCLTVVSVSAVPDLMASDQWPVLNGRWGRFIKNKQTLDLTKHSGSVDFVQKQSFLPSRSPFLRGEAGWPELCGLRCSEYRIRSGGHRLRFLGFRAQGSGGGGGLAVEGVDEAKQSEGKPKSNSRGQMIGKPEGQEPRATWK